MQHVAKPDFVCIGPTRTGTTWLYEALLRHPNVWLPPVKELRYLNEGTTLPAHGLGTMLFSRHWHYVAMRRRLRAGITRALGSPRRITFDRFAEPSWIFRYCFGRRSPEWYAGLFPPDRSRMAGDISPPYYEVPEDRIRELSRVNPRIKVLTFVRNPIEWAWSHAQMVLCQDRGRDLADVPTADFLAFFDEVFASRRPYPEVIALWRRYFPDVFVGRYDELKENPARVFAEICDFLGIDANAVPRATLERRINQGMAAPLPPRLAEHLARQYGDEIASLARCAEAAAR